jgi:predicted phage baseplate assembly protein
MPLQAPNLDNRRFADIVAEARALIPRYAPEWTDHNDSDPGITLVQLFAWMTEMLIYRLNLVPDLNYIKFLQLLGIELKPAQPARAELTFALARDDLEFVIVPRGTQVAAAESGGAQPLVFETETALIALGAKLQALQSFDGFSYATETTKNDAGGQWFYPFGVYAREGSALLLGFDSPLAFTKQQVNLTVYLFTEERQATAKHCDLDLSQMPIPATLVWEYWDSRQWQPISVDKDETRAFTRSGHIYFRGPGEKVKKARLGEVTAPLYWIRCRLARSTYEMAPRLDMLLTNTIGATQALTMRDEVLGGSDGRPNQSLRLANAPVVVRERPEEVMGADGRKVQVTSLRLEVDEGQGFQVWQETEDFYASTADDPHYVLNRTTGEIRFGDGQHGRIPLANLAAANANIVAREYRYGGGKRGNVGAETIQDIQTFVEAIASVTNQRPAYGGSDEETVAEAKRRAPRELKSKERAVTAEDFEFLTVATPGVRVRRAKALPLVHPKFPEAQIPGVITVIIVPDSEASNPMPSEATLSIVCAHLNRHRLLTSEVYVVPPTYHQVKIDADIVVRPEADLAEVKQTLEERLTTYFHPLRGGELGTGWEFGRDIFYSDVYRVVLQTPGVDRIANNQLVIWLDQERHDFCRDVPIEDGALLYSTGHDIQVAYSERE